MQITPVLVTHAERVYLRSIKNGNFVSKIFLHLETPRLNFCQNIVPLRNGFANCEIRKVRDELNGEKWLGIRDKEYPVI